MSHPFTEGYHGTDEASARRIAGDGFKNDYPRFNELYLAAPNQTYLAHEHGQKNAERSGQSRYGIIKTAIPETRIRDYELGPPTLRLWGDEIDEVAIIGLSIFTREGKLVEGEPVEETHER